jgi:hypothetical protein
MATLFSFCKSARICSSLPRAAKQSEQAAAQFLSQWTAVMPVQFLQRRRQ